MRIAVVGPESCGKSTLAQKLAHHFGGRYVPEMARAYFEKHPHINYSIEDVIAIAFAMVRQGSSQTVPVNPAVGLPADQVIHEAEFKEVKDILK